MQKTDGIVAKRLSIVNLSKTKKGVAVVIQSGVLYNSVMSKQTNNHELLIADANGSASSSKSITHRVNLLLEQQTFSPLFIQGDAKDVLKALPTGLVDFCIIDPKN